MKKTTPIIAISLLTVSLLASAQSQNSDRRADSQAKAQQRFQTLDANRDSKLSYAEMQNNPKHRERFEKADLNHDGGLSQDEIRQGHQQKQQQHLDRRAKMQAVKQKMQSLDTNQDQALTRAEIGNEMPKLLQNFSIADANSDGKITREEMRIARMAMRADRQAQAK